MSERDYAPASKEQLVEEARQWDSHGLSPRDWADAPEAIPRAAASTLISLRVPNQMLEVLKTFAQREGIGYQVLLKRWLDERIRKERDDLPIVRLYRPTMVTLAAAFSPEEGQILQEVKEGR